MLQLFFIVFVIMLLFTQSLCYLNPVKSISRRVNYNNLYSRPSKLYSTSVTNNPITNTKKPNRLKQLLTRTVDKPQFVFVGGKGGVGKTSTSSAIAIKLADEGLRTLIVSTDPAHSLGDAFDIDLSSGLVTTIYNDPSQYTSNLSAIEIDIERALDEFKKIADDLDSESLANEFGISKDIIDAIGIQDLANIFTNPPPGIDEIIGLINIYNLAKEKNSNGQFKYERIIIDTAPTGHTLRLLQLPEVLDSIIKKLITFRDKILNIFNTINSMFSNNNNKSTNKFIEIINKLENLQNSIINVKNLLVDPSITQFVVVTIPTQLAISETKRLIDSLRTQNIKVNTMICNQIIVDNINPTYLTTRQNNQQKLISSFKNYLNNIKIEKNDKIDVIEVPYVDTEIRGVYGLRFFSTLAHNYNKLTTKKLTIFGGKGGVGKTSTSASFAVGLSDVGFKTLVVSTDPAHSLSDVLLESLTGYPKLIDRSNEGGQLWAMEIDPIAGFNEFKSLLKSSYNKEIKDISSSNTMGFNIDEIKSDLVDIISGVDDPPPGTDEVVALAKVMSYITNGYELPNGNIIKFDRIVLDTAPTGHTLRMLDIPKFLIQIITKIQIINNKTNKFSNIFNMFNENKSNEDNNNQNNENIEKFLNSMKNLNNLLYDTKFTSFSIITIPTELSINETKKLFNELYNKNINIYKIFINQIIINITNNYINTLKNEQINNINELKNINILNNIDLIEIPYFDMEVRTVYGLKALGKVLFSE